MSKQIYPNHHITYQITHLSVCFFRQRSTLRASRFIPTLNRRRKLKIRDHRDSILLLMVSMVESLPASPHTAHHHDRPYDTNTLVLWHCAGQLLTNHDVHVILEAKNLIFS